MERGEVSKILVLVWKYGWRLRLSPGRFRDQMRNSYYGQTFDSTRRMGEFEWEKHYVDQWLLNDTRADCCPDPILNKATPTDNDNSSLP